MAATYLLRRRLTTDPIWHRGEGRPPGRAAPKARRDREPPGRLVHALDLVFFEQKTKPSIWILELDPVEGLVAGERARRLAKTRLTERRVGSPYQRIERRRSVGGARGGRPCPSRCDKGRALAASQAPLESSWLQQGLGQALVEVLRVTGGHLPLACHPPQLRLDLIKASSELRRCAAEIFLSSLHCWLGVHRSGWLSC